MFDLLGSLTLKSFDQSKGINPQGGKIFYVDCRHGNNSNEGTDPQFPVADLETAYLLCEHQRGDYIFVQDFWTLTAPPLTIDIEDLHIISLGGGNFDNGNDIDGGVLASIELTDNATDFELAGFNLGNDGSAMAVDPTGQCNRLHLHHCTLGWNYSCTDCIGFTGGGALIYPSINNNYFGPNFTNIAITAYFNTGLIFNNIFRNPGVGCITPFAGSFGVGIFGNQFFSAFADGLALAGWAVNLDATSTNNWVHGNLAGITGAACAVNPYNDDSGVAGAEANGWCGNYAGPALSAGPA